jgi:hypothetical protein
MVSSSWSNIFSRNNVEGLNCFWRVSLSVLPALQNSKYAATLLNVSALNLFKKAGFVVSTGYSDGLTRSMSKEFLCVRTRSSV